jgi:O-antigen/teichoic acid export membrane protein
MKKILALLKGKFAQNAGWLIGAKVYQLVINLVISMLMARYLGPSNFGLVNYAASFATLFTAICTLGIDSILVNELLQDRKRNGTQLGSAIGLRLCSSSLSVLTILGLAWALNPDEPITIQVVLLYSISLVFQSFDSINSWFQANLESKVTAAVSAAGYTVVAIYKAVLLITQRDVRWFAAAHAVEYAFVALLLLISYHRSHNRLQPIRFRPKVGFDLLSRSYHFIISGMMIALYGQMDRVMLKAMIDEEAVGYYSCASTISSFWAFILVAIIDAAKPVILAKYSEDKRAFKLGLIRLYGAIIYLSALATIGLSVLSKPLVLIMFGQAYLPARGTLCILSCGTAFAYLGVARSIWLVPQGKQKFAKYIAACGATGNLILNLLLIPRLGIVGAAIATVSTQIFNNLILGFLMPPIRENNKLILKAFVFWRYLKEPKA